MKKFLINNMIGFTLSAIIFGSIGVYAASQILATSIIYKNTTVDQALDDLYIKTNELSNRKICQLYDGYTANTIGAKYECLVGYDLNDDNTEIKKDFYILAIDNNKVKLIMDKNITQGTSKTTMTWMDAMQYIDNNNLKSKWSNVLDVSLPSAQDIANAVAKSNWYSSQIIGDSTWDNYYNNYWFCLETGLRDSQTDCNNSTTKTLWLWDYLRDCGEFHCKNNLNSTEAWGYWTNTMVPGTDNAWLINRRGSLCTREDITNAGAEGVRLVITVLKTNLAN